MADYRYLLGDVLTGTFIAELPFESATYGHVLNAPGSFSGTMGLMQPEPLSTVLREGILLGKNTLYVERDGVIIWGGIPWTSSADIDAGSYTLNGEGWLSYFRRRVNRADKTYTATEQVEIACELIDWAQLQTGGNIGILTTDCVPTGVLRDRSYPAVERKNIGEAIEQLAAVDDGFDFRFESRWNAGTIQTRFLTSYPTTGHQSDLVFEIGRQISGMTVSTDATSLVSHVDAVGATPEDGTEPILGSASDTVRLASMPRLDDVISFTDVSVVGTLDDHAQTRLNRGKEPINLPSVRVQSTSDTPLGSWVVGDNVTVRANEGIISIDGRYRITEYSVSVDDAGGEEISVSFANEEVFSA